MHSVLVVDDEDVLRALIASIVADLGLRPLEATNGREALAVLEAEREPPILVITDVMMPQMNGVALVHQLRQHPRYREIPVVLMSAAERRRADSLAEHFLFKPFEIAELEAIIARYVRARRNPTR